MRQKDLIGITVPNRRGKRSRVRACAFALGLLHKTE